MNILNLLIKEKHVVGVEISDRVIRIAYFRPKKKIKIPGITIKIPEQELVLIEEPIPENIIKEGVVKDKSLLGKTLKDIWNKNGLTENYAIIAIPEDKIYSHIFPFPKIINEKHLKEAIDLAIDFQLPVKRNDVYIGWENAGDSNVINEVLISAIPKDIADGYIEALNFSDIKMLALESHLASIARSIQSKLGEATLFTKENPDDGTTIFILKDGIIKFSRTLPSNFVKQEGFLANEIDRMKTSFESEKKMPVIEMSLSQGTIRDEYLKSSELNGSAPELQSKWLIAIGAAIRGEIPIGEDNRISLLPVGTAEAYEYQKTTTFIALIRNMTIGVSIFFLFAYLASYVFIFSISQILNNINRDIPIPVVSADIVNKQDLINRTNDLTLISQSILSNTINWSILIDEINSRTISGITISSFSAPAASDTMSITGISSNRDVLNQFKKSLQGSDYLTSVELPITNLEQKVNIPFSISFLLKDPSMLYYK